MGSRRAICLALAVLGIVALPAAAGAVTVGWQVEVLVDSGAGFVSTGFAPSSGVFSGPNVYLGDTVRFIVGINGTLSQNLTGYTTTVTADDPATLDYIVGSQVELTGLNFNSVANPNNTLNDGDPGLGGVNSSSGSVATGADQDFYRIDYVVVGLEGYSESIDFSVRGVITTATGADLASGTASVRIYSVFPEPASLLLVGSGLAGLAGFGRKKFRK